MPELCRFYGIIVRMYFDDHAPPHFHAMYGDEAVVIDIRQMAIITGGLSPRAIGLVMEWTAMRQSELLAAWTRAVKAQPPGRIAPLP